MLLTRTGIQDIVDESLGTEIYDRERSIDFLDYPKRVPDRNTIWLFMKRLSEMVKDKTLWKRMWNRFK